MCPFEPIPTILWTGVQGEAGRLENGGYDLEKNHCQWIHPFPTPQLEHAV